jgi:formamidopyrimidine-DNA glycosylase
VPELPDVVVYLEAIERRFVGHRLLGIRLGSPFVLRSVDPRPDAFAGKALLGTRRIGKRLVLAFEDDLFAVVHLMILGRLRLRPAGAPLPAKRGQAAFDFDDGTLLLTEEGSKRRASLHLLRGAEGLADHDPGGLEVPGSRQEDFADRLRSGNHTLKRALTDPRKFSGIGNAYSDEILHRARLSPVRWTSRLDDEQVAALHRAAVDVLAEWTDALRREVGEGFPEKVTAFHDGMAAHGRYRQPCPRCGAPIQRIKYADKELNYCAPCQTEGRLLADRGLSRLLKGDWPKTLDELEARLRG